jgi:hypothetical protein
MASQELLLVLVVKVLDDEEATDVVEDSVLLCRVEVNCVLMLSIVANRMFKLEQFLRLLRLLRIWILHF